MAVVATSAFHESGSDGIPPSAAMRRAWIAWLIMLVLPFLLFVVAVWYATWIREGGSSHTTLNQVWFIIAMIYLIVVVPASLFCFLAARTAARDEGRAASEAPTRAVEKV